MGFPVEDGSRAVFFHWEKVLHGDVMGLIETFGLSIGIIPNPTAQFPNRYPKRFGT